MMRKRPQQEAVSKIARRAKGALLAVSLAGLCCLNVACNKPQKSEQQGAVSSASGPLASTQSPIQKEPPNAGRLIDPIRLAELPVSAYHATLAMDQEAVFLLTESAAYRMVPGQPPQGLKLDLGVGAALTPTSFVYWSKGTIWRTPKEGGDAQKLAKFAHQPQYFVASAENIAWIDLTESGLFTIQTLDGKGTRVLVSSNSELAALNLIGHRLYFVHQSADNAWRPGVVSLTGGAITYGPERKGRRPSMFTGADATYFYDLDKNDIRSLSPDAQKEEVLLSQFICSPLHASSHIYCGCVEGLYAVSKDTHKPIILAGKQAGPIPYVTSNDKWVAWLVDSGSNKLTAYLLPALGAKANTNP